MFEPCKYCGNREICELRQQTQEVAKKIDEQIQATDNLIAQIECKNRKRVAKSWADKEI